MAGTLRDLYRRPLPEYPSWVSGGFLPKGGIALIGGQAKIGKTFLQLDLAHALGTGSQVWGTEYEARQPTSVLIAEREIGEHEFQRRVVMRYKALGVEPPGEIYYLSKTKGMYLDTGAGAKILADEIAAVGANVVIVDPISMAMQGDENSNTDVQRLFSNLKDIQTDYPDLGVVLLHHFGKPPRENDDYDPLSPYNFRGAAKWFDAPDTLITIRRAGTRAAGEWWRLETKWQMRQARSPEEVIKLAVMEGGLIGRATSQTETTPTGRWKK